MHPSSDDIKYDEKHPVFCGLLFRSPLAEPCSSIESCVYATILKTMGLVEVSRLTVRQLISKISNKVAMDETRGCPGAPIITPPLALP